MLKKLHHLLPALGVAGLFLACASSVRAQTTLLSNGALTGGANATSYSNFTTALSPDKNSFAEFATGDSITLSFNLSYTAINSGNFGSNSFDFGFVSSNSSVLYANLYSNRDSVNATSTSLFRSRSGSLFFSTGTTQSLTGADAFSTAFMYDTNTGTTESYSVSLKVTKSSTTDYLIELNIGGNIRSDTVSFVASSTDTQTITGVGFRNNNLYFTSPSFTNVSATFTPAIPEPSTVSALAGMAALVIVATRRRRSA